MATTDHGGPDPGPGLYRLLGVTPGASREEIALAWRRRARAEHPDSHPGDTAAAGRFRALAEAWRILGDPARRAAYDRVLRDGRPAAGNPAPGTRVPVRYPGGRAAGPRAGAAGPPLRAGPVRIDSPHPAPAAGSADEPDITLAVLAGLARCYLARDRGRPW